MKAWHWIVGLGVGIPLLFLAWSAVVHNELGGDGSLMALIQSVEEAGSVEDWARADHLVAQLQARWEEKAFWFRLNQGEQDMSNFTIALKRISGGVSSQDKATVVSNAVVARSLLQKIASVVPTS